MKFPASVILLFLISLTLFCGCSEKTPESLPDEPAADTETLHDEVIAKISAMVLADIPLEGNYKQVIERGVLRVAVPPPDHPFQYTEPDFDIPTGFNPALIKEIAQILNVKPNIHIMDHSPGELLFSRDWGDSFDLLFLQDFHTGCDPENIIKYYYSGHGSWRTICVAGNDANLANAIAEILSYLNETGIFARMQRDYVSGQVTNIIQ